MPNVSNLVEKSDSDIKVNEIKKKKDYTQDKDITTPEFNKLTD